MAISVGGVRAYTQEYTRAMHDANTRRLHIALPHHHNIVVENRLRSIRVISKGSRGGRDAIDENGCP
eukprot:6183938-Pleurochrysis_carterae.AAC.2